MINRGKENKRNKWFAPGMAYVFLVILCFSLFVGTTAASDLSPLEDEIADEIFALIALVKQEELNLPIYKEYRRKLIILVEKYKRKGGDNYKYIFPSELIIGDAKKRGLSAVDAMTSYKECILEISADGNMDETFEKMCMALAKLSNAQERNIEELYQAIERIITSQDSHLTEKETNTIVNNYFSTKDEIRKREREAREKRFNEDKKAREQVEYEKKMIVCQEHLDSNRLTTGSTGNALDCFSEILKIKPNDPMALEGMAAINAKYRGWAEAALKKEDINKAQLYIAKLEMLKLESEDLKPLKSMLKSLEAEEKRKRKAEEVKQFEEAKRIKDRRKLKANALEMTAEEIAQKIKIQKMASETIYMGPPMQIDFSSDFKTIEEAIYTLNASRLKYPKEISFVLTIVLTKNTEGFSTYDSITNILRAHDGDQEMGTYQVSMLGRKFEIKDCSVFGECYEHSFSVVIPNSTAVSFLGSTLYLKLNSATHSSEYVINIPPTYRQGLWSVIKKNK